MIVDTSAVVAIVRDEPEAPAFATLLARADVAVLSAANFVECTVVVDASRDPIAIRRFDELMRAAGIHIKDVTAEQAHIARAAYRDFGRGSGHPARLNFGDCFAYALAKSRDDALLFKGDDFVAPDVRPAFVGA